MIGVPRRWCVGRAGPDGVDIRSGVWRTTLSPLEIRAWIESIDHIERRETIGSRWVDWSKDNLAVQGARAVSRFIGGGVPLRFWRRRGPDAGCPLTDGELFQREGLVGVMVFHTDRPDWWIPLLNS